MVVPLALHPELVLSYQVGIVLLFRAAVWRHYNFIQAAVNLFKQINEIFAVNKSRVQLHAMEFQPYNFGFLFNHLQVTRRYCSFELQRLVNEVVYLLQIEIQLHWLLSSLFLPASEFRRILHTNMFIVLNKN